MLKDVDIQCYNGSDEFKWNERARDWKKTNNRWIAKQA